MQIKPKKFSINTLGCKTNLSESDYIIRDLYSLGLVETDYRENPDFCIINTCTVTMGSDRKTRQIIRRVRRANPDSILFVTGCFTVFNSDFLKEIPVDYIIGNDDKLKIPGIIKKRLEDGKIGIEPVNAAGPGEKVHTRAIVKIQDGCEQNCSYCIIPKVRGTYKSREPEEIISEIGKFSKEGIEEVVLTGIHIGKYGTGIKGLGLAALLEMIVNNTDIKRVRLGSLEVNEINDSIISLISNSGGRIAPHIHIPLQSGSARILKSMNRPYDPDYFLHTVSRVKDEIKKMAITTDIIVGFPGEEEDCFNETIDVVKKAGFARIHVFRYSPRQYTDAYNMKDRVRESVKTERSRILRDLGLQLREGFIKKQIGKELNVLVERISREDMANGMSGNYIRVYFDTVSIKKHMIPSLKGRMSRINAREAYADGLLGDLDEIK